MVMKRKYITTCDAICTKLLVSDDVRYNPVDFQASETMMIAEVKDVVSSKLTPGEFYKTRIRIVMFLIYIMLVLKCDYWREYQSTTPRSTLHFHIRTIKLRFMYELRWETDFEL